MMEVKGQGFYLMAAWLNKALLGVKVMGMVMSRAPVGL